MTIIEIIDSIVHRYERFANIVEKTEAADHLFHQLRRRFSDLDAHLLVKSQEATDILYSITEHLPNGSIRAGAQRIFDLLKADDVRLLSREISPALLTSVLHEAKHDKENLEDLIRRSRFGSERRDIDHSLLHYSADAWNLVIPKHLNRYLNDAHASFVCKSGLRNLLQDEGFHNYTRGPLAPFLKLISLYRADKDGRIHDEAIEWLYEMYDQCDACLKRLKGKKTVGEVSQTTLDFIDRFYRDYVRGVINYQETKMELEKERDRIKKIVQNRASFREHFEEARDDTKDGGRRLLEHRPEIGTDGLLEEYDLADNPHLRGIYRKLGLTR